MEICLKNETRDVGQLLFMVSKGKLVMSTTFDPYKLHELVASTVVMYKLPFQFSEFEYFHAMFSVFQACYSVSF